MSAAKETARAWIDEHRRDLSAWTRAIWDLAEPAWREYRSAAWYVERLRAVGFVVDYAGALVGRDPQAVPGVRAVALLLLVGVLVVLWWRAWQALRGRNEPAGPRVALHGAALALVATVVLSPVFHPWYATWPLALLALTAARTTWFVLPTAAAAFLALPDGSNLARVTKAPGALAMTALLLTVLARTARRCRRWHR